MKFLASSFPLDFEERLSFDFFFLLLSILVSYIEYSCLQELAFWISKDKLKLKEPFWEISPCFKGLFASYNSHAYSHLHQVH